MAATKQKQLSPNIKFGRIVRNCLVTLFVAAFVAVLFSVLPIQGMYRLYTVQSGSMEPKLQTGSLVVVKPAAAYVVGDIITFSDSANSKNTTTHRIVGMNGTSFLTKGDANDSVDMNSVPETNVIGKVLFHIPYIGYPVGYAKTLPGLIILIVIPSTIIIWEELKKLKKEWGKAQLEGKKQEREKSVSAKRNKIIAGKRNRSKEKKHKGPPIGITAFILMVTMSIATLSIKAFFNDHKPAAGSFTSGAWQSNCIVINEAYYDVDASHGIDGDDLNGKKENESNKKSSDEWVELYNNCDRDISLKNWTITDNEKTFTIHSNKSVPAHGYGLISKSAKTWTNYWGFSHLGNLENIQIIEIGENTPLIDQALDNAGDKLILKNSDGILIDQMNYGNNTDVWNPAAPTVAEGSSLSRNPVGHDTDQPTDFIENISPSPGQSTVYTSTQK